MVLAFAPVAFADEVQTAAAIEAFDEARELRQAGELGAACDKLALSYELDPQLGALLHLADCREDNGELATAWSIFRDAEELAHKLGDPRQDVARRRALALAPRRSWLSLMLPEDLPEGAEVFRNGVLVPESLWTEAMPVDRGTYEIRVGAPGYSTYLVTVEISEEGERLEIEVPPLVGSKEALSGDVALSAGELPFGGSDDVVVPEEGAVSLSVASRTAGSDEGAPKDFPLRTLGWASVGVGGAAVILGAVAGAVVLSRYGDLGCAEGPCEASPKEADHLNALRAVSSAGFVAGGLFAAAGVTILVTVPRTPTKIAFRPFATATSVGVAGTF
jgi:hypothetical protein